MVKPAPATAGSVFDIPDDNIQNPVVDLAQEVTDNLNSNNKCIRTKFSYG